MKMRKFLALMLVFAMMLSAFMMASCGGGDDDDDDDEELGDNDLPEIFGGEIPKGLKGDFNVLTESDRTKGQAFNIVDLVAKGNLGNQDIIDAVSMRNDLILEYFRANIKRTPTTSMTKDANQAVQVANKEYDAYMMSVYAGLNFASNGYAVDYSANEWIDLEQSYWDKGTTENLKLAGGNYIAIGDLLTVDKDATYITLFNKEVLGALNAGFSDKDLYDLVESGLKEGSKDGTGGFTIDWLMNRIRDLYVQAQTDAEKRFWENSASPVKYSLFTQQEVVNILLQGSGFTPTKVDDSLSGVSPNLNAQLNGVTFDDAVKKLWASFGEVSEMPFFLDLNTVCTKENVGGGDAWQIIARGGFADDRSAFFMCHAGSIALLGSMESAFGVLPMPKLYDWQVGYKTSVQYGNAHCYVVPMLGDSFADTSCAILELMCYYSSEGYLGEKSLKYAYYDKLLTGTAIRDAQSWKMLDIIFGDEGRVYDLSMALNINDIYNSIPVTVCTTAYSWASKKGSIASGFEGKLANQLEKLLESSRDR